MNDSTSTEDLVEEREEIMVSPCENNKKTHLLKPCLTTTTTSIDESITMLPHQNRSTSSSLDIKSLSLSVSFDGWRVPNRKFKSWATKMASLHKPTWEKAGIFEAVMASTSRICKNSDLVLSISEKWCPETNTFVFPWGETTITLEDVMLLLGFSVLGSPVFAALDSSGEKIKEKLEKEWFKIKHSFVSQAAWMRRFMDSDDELEHVAFLVLWVSYFVFPSRFYYISKAILPICVHLSCGTMIALAPPVLAHLYRDLTLLKHHIRDTTKSKFIDKTNLSALFKLVQVWIWERFDDIRPIPKALRKGEARLARWFDLKQRNRGVRKILDSSNLRFNWRPYAKTVKDWDFPKYYPEKPMWVHVDPSLDDEFISFARFIKVCELVGLDCVEHYFSDRVASQFGMVQDVPCPHVYNNNLSKEVAWDKYNKAIDDLTLYIPSRFAIPRVTPMFCEWRRKGFVDSAETLKPRNIISGNEQDKKGCNTSSFVSSGSKMRRTSRVRIKIAEDSTSKRFKCMKQAREKRHTYMSQARDKTHKYMKRPRENGDSDGEDESLTTAQVMIIEKKKSCDINNNGSDTSEPVGKKSRLEVDNIESSPYQKLSSTRADGNQIVPSQEIEKMNQETDETGREAGKSSVLSLFDENISSETRQACGVEQDVYGSNVERMTTIVNDESNEPKCMLHEDSDMAGEKARTYERDNNVVDDYNMSLIGENNYTETRQPCDDVHGSNVEKRTTMINDGNKEPECLVHEDSAIAREKTSTDVDDDSLIQRKVTVNTDNNEPTSGPNGDKTTDESNIQIDVSHRTQVHDCLLHDTVLTSEETTTKSSEQLENLEKSKEDIGNVSSSYEKSLNNVKMLAASIEERIIKVQRNVAWLKERRAIKQRKIAEARLI